MNIASTPVLVGRDSHRSRRFFILAGAIFLACLVGYTAPVISGGLPSFLAVLASIVIVVGVAMIHAYLNDGLLVTTLLTVAVGVAGIPGLHLADSFDPAIEVTPVESLALIVWFAGLGIGAFVIGAGTRRVVTHITRKYAR